MRWETQKSAHYPRGETRPRGRRLCRRSETRASYIGELIAKPPWRGWAGDGEEMETLRGNRRDSRDREVISDKWSNKVLSSERAKKAGDAVRELWCNGVFAERNKQVQ